MICQGTKHLARGKGASASRIVAERSSLRPFSRKDGFAVGASVAEFSGLSVLLGLKTKESIYRSDPLKHGAIVSIHEIGNSAHAQTTTEGS